MTDDKERKTKGRKKYLKIAFLPLCVPHQLCQEGKPQKVRICKVQQNVTYVIVYVDTIQSQCHLEIILINASMG